MQRDIKKTKITVREDWPTSIASELNGANVGCMAFNIDYIVRRNPKLGVQLIQIYEKARKLRNKPMLSRDDPLFNKALSNLKEQIYANSN